MLKEKSGKSRVIRYNTDMVAVNLHDHLLRDFRSSGNSNFVPGLESAFRNGIDAYRTFEYPVMHHVPVGRFKRLHQMKNLLKKYRFRNDAFTDEELSTMTLEKFMEEQLRLHRPMDLKLTGFKVCQQARKIANRILGTLPSEEVINELRFGRKSSIGCPLNLAYLDVKLTDKDCFTGTTCTTEYFMNQVLPGDNILSRILSSHVFRDLKKQLNYKFLKLVEVPKTWKTYRLITPLTLLGLFYSYGIGRVISVRLKECGLNIKHLQNRHRSLVKGYSRSLTHATADLSAASDSITSELLNRVLPRPWYKALRKTFVRNLMVNDESISTVSVLPMGNGATFPVETLVFYCIIKAIGELTNVQGTYSVYGDDLIYPSKIHKYVVAVFPQLHLKLNLDKTFVSRPFRESCGSDYYRGQDVRPYFLKGESQDLTRVRYEAFLYKVYNGLTARWELEEIPSTITWLLRELSNVSHGILRVPPSFPDYSGIKVSSFDAIPLNTSLLYLRPVKLLFTNGSRWFSFDFLRETPKKRIVESTLPYYWLALQGLTDEPNKFDNFWDTVFPQDAKRQALTWRKIRVKPVSYYHHGRLVVKKRYKHEAVVASRTGATVSTASTKTETISDWL